MAAQALEHNVRFFQPQDEAEVIDVVTSSFTALSRDLWLWKYPENPQFDRSLVLVAENNGRVVGCLHFLPREFKMAKSLKVKAALGAEFAVQQDYRQRGIGSSILKFSRSSRVLEKNRIILTYGFIDPRRAKFYGRNIDSVVIPLSTAMYQKFFDISPIEKRFASLGGLTEAKNGLLDELRGLKMNVLFRLVGMPPFTLRVQDGKIIVNKGETLHPDITVKGDPYLLESVYDGSKGFFDLMIGILRSRIKIRGGLRKILEFYKVVKAIKGLSLRESSS